jgi:hypothetical protein
MPYGSRTDFAEPRDEKALMRRAVASGMLPKTGPSHQAMLAKQLDRIRKGMEITQVRDRRIQQDERITHQLEMERLSEALRKNRGAGLRGATTERMNANNVAAQVVA